MSLTGVWDGHYFQNWIEGGPAEMDETSDFAFAIQVEIVDNGGNLSGRMRDVRTSWEIDLSDALQVSTVSRFQKTMLKIFYPKSSNARIANELPSNSSIEGKLDGQTVSFKKSYEGVTRLLFNSAGRERVTLKEPEPIFYLGTLSEDGSLIEGKFVIGDPDNTRPEAHGFFRLRRVG